MPVLRSAHGKPLLDVATCLALVSSTAPGGVCACAVCLASVRFSVSHHGDWLLLVGQRACGCHCRSMCASCVDEKRSWAGGASDLGCDVTTTDLPQRYSSRYEKAWPVGALASPPSLAAAQLSPVDDAVSARGHPSFSAPSSPSPFASSAAVLSGYLDMFASQLSPGERTRLRTHYRLPTPDEVRPLLLPAVEPSATHCLSAFAAVWSVKEAVVKAVGLGLSIQLTALHTTLASDSSASGLYGGSVQVRCVRGGAQACVAASASRPQCAADSVDCCRSLDAHWRVDVCAVDSRHTAAIARSSRSEQRQQHESEHAAGCKRETESTLTTLASGSPHLLSPMLRLLHLTDMLATVGITLPLYTT